MKTIQVSVLVAGALLLAGVANADTVTVQHSMNYQNNDWAEGVWFVEPGSILDHSPYCRVCNEDWGWTHVVTDLIPDGATGIESATLTIIAWKIDVDAGEDDVIYALPERPATTALAKTTGDNLGMLNSAAMSQTWVVWADSDGSNSQIYGYEDLWSTTTFDLPAETLDDLWANGQVCFYIDIDQTNGSGQRATLESAVLQINYIAPAADTPALVNVYRFWSPSLAAHFYTASESEMENVVANYWGVWAYEGVAFAGMADNTDTMAVPVYRFWSPVLSSHFYTADQYEADYVIANYWGVWGLEGVAYYAYPPDYQPENTYPVYRFWSNTSGHHFYSMNEDEVAFVIENYSNVWVFEGVVWNAFMP